MTGKLPKGPTDIARRRLRTLRVGGVFAGIGGFEVGLSKAGHDLRWLCEIDPVAQAVLRKHFSGIPITEDVSTLAGLPKGIDLLAAGFPCQDLSQVGQTKGLHGEKSALVSHVFRLLKRNRVPWVALENVPFMLHLHKGAAIALITDELERLGYRWAYRTVDTRAFGLPQRRARVFLLASNEEDPWRRLFCTGVSTHEKPAVNAPPCGFYWTEGNRGVGWAPGLLPTLKGGSALGIPSPPAIWLRDGSIVTPDIRDAERAQGFSANWTVSAETVGRKGARWRLVGNAVTTSVAEWLGKCLAGELGDEPELVRSLRPGDPWPPAAVGQRGTRHEVAPSTWPVRRKLRPIDR